MAIFQKDVLVYATNSFEQLYNHFDDATRARFHRQVSLMRLELQESHKVYARTRLMVFPLAKEIEVSVYLLNKIGSPKSPLSLVMVQSHLSTKYPNSPIEQLTKEAWAEELSPAFSELIGDDPKFQAVLLKAQKAAKSDYPVLIEGESGTGKEILARTIHQTSRRNQKKFVDINCAAIPDQLIDSELFGYEKGAFTGAVPGGRHGLFVEAHRGTLFLDEIADASAQTQAKLLRVLNEGYFKRVGSTKNIDVDVRIISATNKDLSQLIKEDRFRQDLLYRLNTINIRMPALRERPGDIALLANHFLIKHSQKQHRPLNLAARSMDILNSYHWPGNVRELKGVIDYMAIMATGSQITEDCLPDFLLPTRPRPMEGRENVSDHAQDRSRLDAAEPLPLPTAVQQMEMEVIKEVMARAKNRSEAIKMLGISRRTFYAKLKQYNLL